MTKLTSLILICLTFIFSLEAKSSLAKDTLRKPNTRLNIGKVKVAAAYQDYPTCARWVDSDGEAPGYCARYAEHVFKLNEHSVWTHNNVNSGRFPTKDGMFALWRCYTHFAGQYPDFHKLPLLLKQVADYPSDLKKEIRIPYSSEEDRHQVMDSVIFGVKKKYEKLPITVEKILDETKRGPQCQSSDQSDEEPTCSGDFKKRVFSFQGDLQGSPFTVNCSGLAPGDTQDPLDLTVDQLQSMLGDAVIEY